MPSMGRKEAIRRACCNCMGQTDWRARLSVTARNLVRECAADCPLWEYRMGAALGEPEDEEEGAQDTLEELYKEIAQTECNDE